MVNEFILDDLSSSWTDSIYKNKSNSGVNKEWRHFHIHIYKHIYIHESCAQMHPLFTGSQLVKPCACIDLPVKDLANSSPTHEVALWTRVRVGGANFDLESNVAPTWTLCFTVQEIVLNIFFDLLYQAQALTFVSQSLRHVLFVSPCEELST